MWNLCTQNPGPSAEVCLGLWNYGTKKNDPSGCGFSIVVLWDHMAVSENLCY